MIELTTLHLDSNQEALDWATQTKVYGGVEAHNSLITHPNGSTSSFNLVVFEPGDSNKTVTQINAARSHFDYGYRDNGNDVLVQTNATKNASVRVQGVSA